MHERNFIRAKMKDSNVCHIFSQRKHVVFSVRNIKKLFFSQLTEFVQLFQKFQFDPLRDFCILQRLRTATCMYHGK